MITKEFFFDVNKGDSCRINNIILKNVKGDIGILFKNNILLVNKKEKMVYHYNYSRNNSKLFLEKKILLGKWLRGHSNREIHNISEDGFYFKEI